MRKRATDLSLEELAGLGANAALRAAGRAQKAGSIAMGTVDLLEDGQAKSTLAERHPSGAVTLRVAKADVSANKKGPAGAAPRRSRTD